MHFSFKGKWVFWLAIAGCAIWLKSTVECYVTGKTGWGTISLAATSLFGFMAWTIWYSAKVKEELLAFVSEKRNEILEGEVYFRGSRVTRESQFIQFKVVL